MSAADEYRSADSETVYTTPQQLSTARRARAAIAELEAALAERDGMLEEAWDWYETRWTPDHGQYMQHDAWLHDLRARAAEGSET